MLMRLFLRGPIIPTSTVLRWMPRTLSANGSCDKFSKGSPKYFPMPEIRRFLAEAMMKVGACEEHSLQLADVLAEADYSGHYSHGLNRIEMYVRDAQTGKCDVNVKPCVLKDTVSTAWVEGNNGLGMVVGNFCMKLAIAKAKQTGVGWVVAKGSNHYGIASWYSTQALKKCMLAALGTNPLSLAAPALKRDSFILDMATSAVAVGKIEVKMKAQQPIPEGWAQDAEGNITTDASVAFKASHLMPLGGSEETSGFKGYGLAMLVETLCGVLAEVKMKAQQPIPEGWAQDVEGNITTDASVAFKASHLMPLGGSEETSGFKGYGLAMLVETLCGVLAGSLYGPRINKWMDKEFKGAANLGQCFIAVNPECFAPGFHCGDHLIINSYVSNIAEYRTLPSVKLQTGGKHWAVCKEDDASKPTQVSSVLATGCDANASVATFIRNKGERICRCDLKTLTKAFENLSLSLVAKWRYQICKDKPVLVPGDPEKINMKKVNELGGVPYSDTQINNMVVDNFLLGTKLAEELKIPPMQHI
uniref:Malate dehydrogenase n=1 Tax=Timema cristinae TaxID=61476 RepID=A0A7R9CJE3_TIMCR|nr:unnamed protein product [Timema cristinae]